MRNAAIVLLLLAVSTSFAGAQSFDKSQLGADAAVRWLGYVDSGDYAKSWDLSSTLLQKSISKEDWEKQLAGERGPFGMAVSRQQTSSTFTTQLPDEPDGDYVIVREQTHFEHKRASETITLTFERDKWRVVGYSIK